MSNKCIVVGFDAAPPTHVTSMAVALARALEADLRGIFVEELDALRLAELPFAVVIESSGRASRLDPGGLGTLLRRAAERAERELERAAMRGHVRTSFGVRRGRFLRALQAEAGERDLIVVDSSRHVQSRPLPSGPVAVVLDQPESATLLCDLAALVSRPGEPIIALVPAEGLARERASSWADDRQRPLLLVSVEPSDAKSVASAVLGLPRRLMIVRRRGAWLDERNLGALRRELDCPLLIVG